MKRYGMPLWVLLVLMICQPVLAQTVNIDARAIENAELNEAFIAERLTFATQFISVSYDLGEAVQELSLRVTIDETGEEVYSKAYGPVSGHFQSDDVYLKFSGGTSRYTISLSIGENTLAFPFRRILMRLQDNTACSYGLPFSQMLPHDENTSAMGTVVCLSKSDTFTVPLIASGMYKIGRMKLEVLNGKLTVAYELNADAKAEINAEKLYVLTDLSELGAPEERFLSLYPSYTAGVAIDIQTELNGAAYAVIYLPLTLSYDPNGLERFVYQPDARQQQDFEAMQTLTMQPPVG